MSQHDYVIANQTFPNFRTDLNSAFAASVSQNSGASAPSTTYAYQLWYDTGNDILKMRNADNDAWIDLFTVDQSADTATAPSVAAGSNLIINGNMAVSQRGTSSTSSGYHSVDRYKVDFLNFDQLGVTQSQSTTVPSGEGFSNSLKVAVTTQETTLDANELFIIRQFIEAQNLQHLAYGTSSAKSLTLSFWVRSSLAGKYSVMFYSADGVRSNLQSFTISSSDTWEFVTITIDGDTAGTINNDNGAGLQVTWVLAAGTNWTGTPHTGWGAFVETDDYAFSDQVNFAAQTGDFYITGVQLEEGTVANPVFQHESYAETLHKCQRYCIVYGGTQAFERVGTGLSNSTVKTIALVAFPVEMRSAPSITFSSASHWAVWNSSTVIAATGISGDSFSTKVSTLGVNVSSGLTAGKATQFLANNSTSARLIWSAEL